MGTEDETELTLRGRATAAAGAALVAACIVNPLDVIKTRIQAQAMAESSGQRGCSTPWTCTSTLYEHAAHHHSHSHSLHHMHGLSDCQHHQHSGSPVTARSWLPLRHTHTWCPEAAGWVTSSSFNSGSSTIGRLAAGAGSGSSCSAGAAAAAAAAISAARSAAADKAAAAAAAFRRWGITEGPWPIRRTPPFPVPNGWSPAPVTAAMTSATTAAGAAGILPASAAAGASCQCPPASAVTLPNNSMWEMAKAIRAREGLPVLWRGTWASLLIAVPMVGIYMPLYDTLLDRWSSKMGSLAPVVSGTAARMAACFCVAPFELVRTRLQASAAAGASMRSTLTSLVTEQQHGAAQQQLPQTQHARLAATAAATTQLQPQQQMQQQAQIRPSTVLRAVPRMWTGFSATLVRDVPFSALYWALVEPLRQAMLPVNSHWPPLQHLADSIHKPHQAGSSSSSSGRLAAVPPSQQHTLHHSQLEILIANMISGFVAGGFAAGATTPFDVVKTRMQIASPSQQQQQQQSRGSGMRVFRILGEVYHKEGLEGLFSGLKPRAARAAPACAIVISVYELLKSYLTPA